MIEIKEYQVRSAGGKAQTSTKEITLSPKWLKEHRIEIGDELSVIANNVLIIVPPGLSREEEDRVLEFARRDKEEREIPPND